jgi:hypothetical protein
MDYIFDISKESREFLGQGRKAPRAAIWCGYLAVIGQEM